MITTCLIRCAPKHQAGVITLTRLPFYSRGMNRNAVPLLTTFWLSITPAMAGIPLTIAQRHILVDQIYIDGAGPFRFALDTGAQSSSLRTDVAARIGLKAEYRVETESVGGVRYLAAGVAKKVTLGNHSAIEVEMVIHDLDAARQIDPGIEGVLGQNFLARFNYLLDMRDRLLSFENSRAGDRIPFSLVSDRMVVRAGEMALVLDSGCGDLVLFHDRKDLKETGSVTEEAAVTNVSNVRVARLPKLRVGERIWTNVQTAVVPGGGSGADGLLPFTLFDSVYVNNAGSYVVVR